MQCCTSLALCALVVVVVAILVDVTVVLQLLVSTANALAHMLRYHADVSPLKPMCTVSGACVRCVLTTVCLH
jgi:hypothetical protein